MYVFFQWVLRWHQTWILSVESLKVDVHHDRRMKTKTLYIRSRAPSWAHFVLIEKKEQEKSASFLSRHHMSHVIVVAFLRECCFVACCSGHTQTQTYYKCVLFIQNLLLWSFIFLHLVWCIFISFNTYVSHSFFAFNALTFQYKWLFRYSTKEKILEKTK